ncbi:MAG: type II toxin-antitoxin system HicB family antitoxin [Candidatus Binatia bacterium]
MRLHTFEIVIESEQGGDGYVAYCPTLSGCFCSGATPEEARRKVRESVAERVCALVAGGHPVPQRERLVVVEEIAIVLPEDGVLVPAHAGVRDMGKSS